MSAWKQRGRSRALIDHSSSWDHFSFSPTNAYLFFLPCQLLHWNLCKSSKGLLENYLLTVHNDPTTGRQTYSLTAQAVALPLVFLLVLWLASAVSLDIAQSSGSGETGIKTQSRANEIKADKMRSAELLFSSSCYMTICFPSPPLVKTWPVSLQEVDWTAGWLTSINLTHWHFKQD